MTAIHPDDLDSARAAFAATVDSGVAEESQYRIVRPNGEVRWVRVKCTPIRDADGHLQRVAGLAADVTELRVSEIEKRRLEAELTQAQKMESVGRLAGWVWRTTSTT